MGGEDSAAFVERRASCLAGLEIPLLASFPYLLGSAERVPYGQWSERACVVGVLARSGLSRVRAFVVCASASRVRTLDGARVRGCFGCMFGRVCARSPALGTPGCGFRLALTNERVGVFGVRARNG